MAVSPGRDRGSAGSGTQCVPAHPGLSGAASLYPGTLPSVENHRAPRLVKGWAGLDWAPCSLWLLPR